MSIRPHGLIEFPKLATSHLFFSYQIFKIKATRSLRALVWYSPASGMPIFTLPSAILV